MGRAVGESEAVGVIEEIKGVMLGTFTAVAVGKEVTCPQPANKVAIKTSPTTSKVRLGEFIALSISNSYRSVYWLKRQFILFGSYPLSQHKEVQHRADGKENDQREHEILLNASRLHDA